MWKRSIVGLLIVGALVAVAANPSPARSFEERPRGSEQAPVVRVARAEMVDSGHARKFSGQLRASSRARLGFETGGRVVHRPVEIGTRVRAGQVLARLDRKPLEHAVAAAAARLARMRSDLAQSKRTVARADMLTKAQAFAEADREDAHSRSQSLRAATRGAKVELREAQRMLAEATLRAPFDGIVTEVLVEPGEMVSPGVPVVVLSGEGGLELEVEVPERVLAELTVGREVSVELPLFPGEPLRSEVIGIGSAVVERGRLFPVLVKVPMREGLTAGVTAELVLEVEQGRGLSVPVEAVINPGGRSPTVFVVRDAIATELAVEVLRVVGSRAIVASGELREGDTVIIGGLAGVAPGERVEVMP